MGRLWICLPLCLLLQDQRPMLSEATGADVEGPPPPLAPSVKRLVHVTAAVGGLAPAAFPAQLPWPGLVWQVRDHLLDRPTQVRLLLAHGVGGFSPLGFPACFSPGHGHLLADRGPGQEMLEDLRHENPVKFLQMCLAHYDRHVQAYSCTMIKRERIKNKLQGQEENDCHFREKPFSIYMKWIKGERLAKAVLYVEGEYKDGGTSPPGDVCMFLARPSSPALRWGIFPQEMDGANARDSGRYTLKEFGMKIGAQRTLNGIVAAQAKGTLRLRYFGLAKLPQIGDRLCYKFVRTPIEPPEEDGLFEMTIYIDVETWLQVGSVLKDKSGALIGEYFFRDVKLNPTFKEDQFKRSAL